MADAVTEVAVTVEHGAESPGEANVALLTTALAELAAAVREQREPADLRLPETEQLSGVVDQLNAAFDAVRGPDLTTSSPMWLMRRFRRA